jgi:DNA repair protein RadA/Sms
VAKSKSVFFCGSCGYESPKWLGKCPSCGEWNQFVEETVRKKSDSPLRNVEIAQGRSVVQKLDTLSASDTPRHAISDMELSRVLGGGIVPGSLVLVGGEPGIGKSTLMLQAAISHRGAPVLYVSGEESAEQVAQRARRLSSGSNECYILTQTDPEQIIAESEKLKPAFIVVDSVQTLQAGWLDATPGSVSQIRESAALLMRYAKASNVPIFLIGHITKEGSIAGPKVLEHMVDTVALFEGDQHHRFRLLRCTKNRFGSTFELGIYQMEGTGLIPVSNPSDLLLSLNTDALSGSAAAAIIEGVRPLMIEVQALVSSAVYGTPQRSATGFDVRRLHMLLAVLEKRCGFRLGAKDVFLNIAGGIKVNDPSIDLAVVASVLSSSEDLGLPSHTCFAGEVGLSGEIRPVMRTEQRIVEAEKLGFKRIFISSHSAKKLASSEGLEILRVSKVQDMLTAMFG